MMEEPAASNSAFEAREKKIDDVRPYMYYDV